MVHRSLKRLVAPAALLAATYAAGTTLLLIIYDWQFNALSPQEIWSAIYRSGFWTIGLALLLIVPLRPRHWFAEAAAVTALVLAGAFVAEYGYMQFLLAHGWMKTSPLLEALRSAPTAFVVMLPATMVARWLSANDKERSAARRRHQSEVRLSEARLQLLRSQLHPHFLFNALNSVAALIRHDARGAEEMLARLARFYAVTAATDGRQFVPLSEELGFVREYLGIEQIRFGKRLECTFDVAPEVCDAEVPALILQPLAENAIKHGVARMTGPAAVVLQARRAGPRITITLLGGGPLLGRASDSGVGLENTRRRLKQLFGSDFRLALDAVEDTTRMTLEVPLRRTEAAA